MHCTGGIDPYCVVHCRPDIFYVCPFILFSCYLPFYHDDYNMSVIPRCWETRVQESRFKSSPEMRLKERSQVK